MEQNTPYFRLRLNLFDAIILVIALIAAGVLGWLALHPTPASSDLVTNGTIQYTVRLNRWPEGTGSLVQVGDELTDNTQNRELGEVVGVRTEPTRMTVVNQEERRQVLATVAGYEDVLLTVQAPCEVSRYSVALDEGDFILRVGGMVYLRGEGYMGSGPVESIEILSLEAEE